MDNDTATRISALMAELGKQRASVKDVPTDEQKDLMRANCGIEGIGDALALCLGAVVSTSTTPAMHLVDTVGVIADMLAVYHKESDNRRVTKGEVLRAIADYFDKTDSALNEAMDVVKKVLVDIVAKMPAGDIKPGSN